MLVATLWLRYRSESIARSLSIEFPLPLCVSYYLLVKCHFPTAAVKQFNLIIYIRKNSPEICGHFSEQDNKSEGGPFIVLSLSRQQQFTCQRVTSICKHCQLETFITLYSKVLRVFELESCGRGILQHPEDLLSEHLNFLPINDLPMKSTRCERGGQSLFF